MPEAVCEVPAQRLCGMCGYTRPIEEFRRVRRGENARHGDCNHCRRRMDRRAKARKQCRRMSRDLALLERAENVERLEALARVMIDAWGGLVAFSEAFHEFVTSSKPSSTARCRALTALVQVQFAAAETRQRFDADVRQYHSAVQRDALEAMDESEFDEQVRDQVVQLLESDPSLRAAVLAKVGAA